VSERRRRSSSDDEAGDRRKRVLTWLAWSVVVALLGGNLAVSFFRESKNDKPHGFITLEHVRTAALWLPIGCAVAMSVLGLYWSSKAYSQNERSSLLWARRGYVFGLIGSAVFLFACYDENMFPREWIVSVAAVVIAGQALFFGMMSFKEFRRAQLRGGSRRGRSSSADDAPPPPVAENADPAK